MAEINVPAKVKLMDLLKPVLAFATVQLLTGCGRSSRDPASETRALLTNRFGHATRSDSSPGIVRGRPCVATPKGRQQSLHAIKRCEPQA